MYNTKSLFFAKRNKNDKISQNHHEKKERPPKIKS